MNNQITMKNLPKEWPEKKTKNSVKHFGGNGYYNQQGYNEAIEDCTNALPSVIESVRREITIDEQKPRLELWNEAVEEGRRRERGFILKLLDGNKVVYKKGDERFDETLEDGEEKDHIDSCCNETIDEIIKTLTPLPTKEETHAPTAWTEDNV